MGKIVEFFKGRKGSLRVALLVLIGVLLIFFSGSACFESEPSDSGGNSLEEYKERTEGELESLCHSVRGVGRCRVYLTLARGEKNSYKGSTVIETKPPEVLGVTVICDGGDKDSVRLALVDMLTALFNIGSNRVAILKLNS